MRYFVSGLHLQTNQELAGLPPEQRSAPVDVQVRLGETLPGLERLLATQQLWYASADLNDRGQPLLTIFTLADGAYFRLIDCDGTEFLVDRVGCQAWGLWSSRLAMDDRTSYLLGPVLSFVLCLRGVTCLHASAISIGQRAVAFVGPEGSGKSVAAAALGARGYPVIADDIVALRPADRAYLAQPAYATVRLRPSALSALNGAILSGSRWSSTADGSYVDLDLLSEGYSFEQRALPLAVIYFLTEPSDDVLHPVVEAVQSGEGLMSLIANTWATRVLTPSMRAEEFKTLSRLSASMPLRRVRNPGTPEGLCELVLNDLQSICSAEPLVAVGTPEN